MQKRFPTLLCSIAAEQGAPRWALGLACHERWREHEARPNSRIALGLHAFGDRLPVGDFGLIHKKANKQSLEPHRTGDPKNPAMVPPAQMTDEQWHSVSELSASSMQTRGWGYHAIPTIA